MCVPAVLLFFAGEVFAVQEDVFTAIEDRMIEEFQQAPRKGRSAKHDGRLEGILASLHKDGSFEGIDYRVTHRTQWSPIRHLGNVFQMCRSYTIPGTKWYRNSSLKTDIEKALQYWYDANPRCNNWWMNQIAVPQQMGRILLLMDRKGTPVESGLRKKLIARMESVAPSLAPHTGANKVDVAIHYMYRACLTHDARLMKMATDALFEPLSYTMKEGIQHDNSYMQHGPQLYVGGYGMVMIQGIVTNAKALVGTEFALSGEKLGILSRFVRETYLPSIRGGSLSWNLLGRGVTRPGSPSQRGLPSLLEDLCRMDPAHEREYRQAIDRIRGDRGPEWGVVPASRYYYRADYVRHQRPGYFFDVRMVSNRTARNEQGVGNGEGFKQYFLSDGATALQISGKEFDGIYPVWDWSAIPGVTCPQMEKIPLAQSWVAMGKNPFVGGVSDGMYSAVAYRYADDYQGIDSEARKAWFMFDREIVCLGSAIGSRGKAPLRTTVNQCLWEGGASVVEDGRERKISKGNHECGGKSAWVLHGGVGYWFPSGGNVKVVAREQQGKWHDINTNYSDEIVKKDVFSLWVDHGIQPEAASYAYAIVPGIKNAGDVKNYPVNNIGILRNDATVQAVYHKELDLLQTVFWEPGELAFKGGVIRVDRPCILMMKRLPRKGLVFYLADPTQTLDKVTVTLNPAFRSKKVLTFRMDGDKAWEKGRTHVYEMDRNRYLSLTSSASSPYSQ